MKNIKRTVLFSLAFVGVLFLSESCSKVEGPGGSSSIVGKIKFERYDTGGNLIHEFVAQDQDVYLIYGEDGTYYDDDTKTSYDGSFEFNYLQKGKYTLFVYQNCSTCADGDEDLPLFTEIEITDKKSTNDVGTIIILD